jgi:hypothetical protein
VGNGGEKLLKVGGVGVGVITIKKEGRVGGRGVGWGCGSREGEGGEGVVFQREARHREVLDMWEKIMVGQDIVNHVGPPTMGEASKIP